jgi:phospholipid/cholesterol/gamma-HCH transport system substrate-binding protein
MDVDFSRKERVVGVFVIGVAVILLATIITIGRGKDWFKKYVTYYTTFNESYNLQRDADVKLFNAAIGKVKKITLVGNKVNVQLAILEDFANRIREDSVATVESPTFIGSEFIAILPGGSDTPLVPPEGEIKSREKRSVSDLLDEFQVEKTAKMVVKAAQDLSELAEILRQPEGPLFRVLDNAERITSNVQGITGDIEAGRGTLGALLKSKELIDAIMFNIAKIETTLTNIDQAAAQVPDTITLANENLTMIKDLRTELMTTIQRANTILAAVEANIDKLGTIMANAEQGSQDLPQITQGARYGIQEIREGVENIDKVVQSLQQNVLIRSNLPPEPTGQNTDAGLRP